MSKPGFHLHTKTDDVTLGVVGLLLELVRFAPLLLVIAVVVSLLTR